MAKVTTTKSNFEIDENDPGYVEQDKGKILQLDGQWIGTDALSSCIALIPIGINREGRLLAGLWHFSHHPNTPTPQDILGFFWLAFLTGGVKVKHFYAIGGCKEFKQVKHAIEQAKSEYGLSMNMVVDLTEDFDDDRSTKVRIERQGPDLLIRYWVE